MTDNIASFADAAILRITERLAGDAEDLARMLEEQSEQISGPEALRMFAATMRRASAMMKQSP